MEEIMFSSSLKNSLDDMMNTLKEQRSEEETFNEERIIIKTVLREAVEGKYTVFEDLKNDGFDNTYFTTNVIREIWNTINHNISVFGGVTPLSIVESINQDFREMAYLELEKIVNTHTEQADFEIVKRRLLDKKTKNNLINLADFIKSNADNNSNQNEVYNSVVSKILEMDEVNDGFIEANNEKAVDMFKDFFNGRLKGEVKEGISTGIQEFDNVIGRFPFGLPSIVVARPGHGKTSLGLTVFSNAIDRGENPIFISLEMPFYDLFQKLVAIRTDIPTEKINKPNTLTKEQVQKIRGCINDLRQKQFTIVDFNGLKVSQLEIQLRKAINNNSQFAVVDYVQLIHDENGKNPKDAASFRDIFKNLRESIKRINKKGSMAVLLLAQAGRESDNLPADKRVPRMGDIEWSSSLEQDAALVVGISNPAKYDSDKDGEIQFLCSKNRYGDTGFGSAGFDGPTQKVYSKSNPQYQERLVEQWLKQAKDSENRIQNTKKEA